MKRASIIGGVIIALVAVIGGILYYTLMPKNTSSVRPEGVSDSSGTIGPDRSSDTYQEFSQLKGEEYDRVYIANMISHHLGEMTLAKVAQLNAERQEIKALADSILASRTKELESLMTWQKKWGYPSSVGEDMIDHSAMLMDAKMAMASEALLKQSGSEFDQGFTDKLAGFHQTALDMSALAEVNAVHIEVKMLANSSNVTYAKELESLKAWQD